MRPPVSLKDVARAAGVSTITASRALRGLPLVTLATRSHVSSVAESLGYVPNLVASGLRSRRTGMVAVVVPTVAGSIFAETVEAISRALDQAGYKILIGESSFDIHREQAVLEGLVQRRPDGVIIAGVNHTETSRQLLGAMRVPVVEIWDLVDDPVDSVVGFSNRDAAYAFTGALIDKGYRSFALATGPTEHQNRATRRTQGHLQALDEAGFAPGPSIVIPHFLGILHSGETLRDFVKDHPEVDCLFCTNELIAIGATVQCRRAGLRVPADIAIVGFGDVEAASIIDPPLTTVVIHGAEMGRVAARIIRDRLAGATAASEKIDVGFDIVWRGTA